MRQKIIQFSNILTGSFPEILVDDKQRTLRLTLAKKIWSSYIKS